MSAPAPDLDEDTLDRMLLSFYEIEGGHRVAKSWVTGRIERDRCPPILVIGAIIARRHDTYPRVAIALMSPRRPLVMRLRGAEDAAEVAKALGWAVELLEREAEEG